MARICNSLYHTTQCLVWFGTHTINTYPQKVHGVRIWILLVYMYTFAHTSFLGSIYLFHANFKWHIFEKLFAIIKRRWVSLPCLLVCGYFFFISKGSGEKHWKPKAIQSLLSASTQMDFEEHQHTSWYRSIFFFQRRTFHIEVTYRKHLFHITKFWHCMFAHLHVLLPRIVIRFISTNHASDLCGYF